MTPAVELRNASKSFGPVHALHDVSLTVRKGEFLSLLGPSGCGKSTTLNLIGGFEDTTSGEVLIDGQPVTGTPPYLRPVNTVFQSYALFPHMSVAENVEFGLRMKGTPKPERKRAVADMLHMVSLDGFADRRPAQLSGGQRQRVALARALVNHPAVLLLDEPLGALDLKLRKQMQTELTRLQRQVGITFVYVTHDQEEAMAMSDRIAVMDRGHLLQLGTPAEILDDPQSAFVMEFFGSANVFPTRVTTIADGLARTETGIGRAIGRFSPGDPGSTSCPPRKASPSPPPALAGGGRGEGGCGPEHPPGRAPRHHPAHRPHGFRHPLRHPPRRRPRRARLSPARQRRTTARRGTIRIRFLGQRGCPRLSRQLNARGTITMRLHSTRRQLLLGAAALAAVPRQAAAAGQVNWLAWGGHVEPQGIKSFFDATGIRVNHIGMSGNAETFAKLKLSGTGQYDLFEADGLWPQRYYQEGMIEALDLDAIPNVKANMYPEFKKIPGLMADGKMLMAPWGWNPTVLVYNKSKVSNPPASYEALLDPKYKGHVSFSDQHEFMWPVAALLLGFENPFGMNKQQLAKATEILIKVKRNAPQYLQGLERAASSLCRGNSLAWPVLARPRPDHPIIRRPADGLERAQGRLLRLDRRRHAGEGLAQP